MVVKQACLSLGGSLSFVSSGEWCVFVASIELPSQRETKSQWTEILYIYGIPCFCVQSDERKERNPTCYLQ